MSTDPNQVILVVTTFKEQNQVSTAGTNASSLLPSTFQGQTNLTSKADTVNTIVVNNSNPSQISVSTVTTANIITSTETTKVLYANPLGPSQSGLQGTQGIQGVTGPTGATGSTPDFYVMSINGVSGSITLKVGQGLTLNGFTFSVNYIRGGESILTTRLPDKQDWILYQEGKNPFAMEKFQFENLSYTLLGSSTSTMSGNSIKLGSSIDGVSTTATDKYISFTDFKSSLSTDLKASCTCCFTYTEGITSPSSPCPGDKWFKTDDGIVFIRSYTGLWITN